MVGRFSLDSGNEQPDQIQSSTMAFDLITILVVGHDDKNIAEKIRIASPHPTEADNFDVHCFDDDQNIEENIARIRPQVIFSFGELDAYPNLYSLPLDFRRRWVHYPDDSVLGARLAEAACVVFVDIATHEKFADFPLVSVFTPTYQTGERIYRAYESLKAQSYNNWEWVIYDDSPDDETFRRITEIARMDTRVRVFRSHQPCGVIGEVKRRACGLSRGSILVEMDHDDELTPQCLYFVVDAFRRFPDAGFAYTDCAEIYEDGENGQYPEGYGFGFGSYRKEEYRGHTYLVTNYPSINAKTMRHIVGVPNHVRAWTRSAYVAAGGHSAEIHVADDYELCIRTFLTTRMVHIKRFGYIQYLGRGESNTHRARNREIQRLVRMFFERYNTEIHERLVALGVDDFIWVREGELDWSIANPDPTPIANYIYD
jgi:O-antigen biosynthesis protein